MNPLICLYQFCTIIFKWCGPRGALFSLINKPSSQTSTHLFIIISNSLANITSRPFAISYSLSLSPSLSLSLCLSLSPSPSLSSFEDHQCKRRACASQATLCTHTTRWSKGWESRQKGEFHNDCAQLFFVHGCLEYHNSDTMVSCITLPPHCTDNDLIFLVSNLNSVTSQCFYSCLLCRSIDSLSWR